MISERALVRIKIAMHDWLYSIKQRELYYYEVGNFEAYPQKGDNKLNSHHFFKVLPLDARQVFVGKDAEGYWWIQDTPERYYSQSRERLYRRHNNEVEAFSLTDRGGFRITRPSTIPWDARAAVVKPGHKHGTHKIKTLVAIPIDVWQKNLTSQKFNGRSFVGIAVTCNRSNEKVA